MVSLIWIITGMILFGGMAAGAIRLWIKSRREAKAVSDPFGDAKIPSDED
jgi:carbon starvation protein CstA